LYIILFIYFRPKVPAIFYRTRAVFDSFQTQQQSDSITDAEDKPRCCSSRPDWCQTADAVRALTRWQHFCMKLLLGRHLDAMTSYHLSVIRCVFTWRKVLTNFIPIRFETTEPWAFIEEVAPTRRTTRWVAVWLSVPDPPWLAAAARDARPWSWHPRH